MRARKDAQPCYNCTSAWSHWSHSRSRSYSSELSGFPPFRPAPPAARCPFAPSLATVISEKQNMFHAYHFAPDDE